MGRLSKLTKERPSDESVMSMFGFYNQGRGFIKPSPPSPRELRRAEKREQARLLKRALKRVNK